VQFSKQALTLGETFFPHQNIIMLFYHENGEWLLFYMPCSFSSVRMRECEVSPVVKTYSTKWPIHRRQVSSSSLACSWYIHREEWLQASIWQMTIHSVFDHLPYFSKRMRSENLRSWCSSTDMLTNCKPTDKWAERWVSSITTISV